MKVFKNLFGKGNKINASEIAVAPNLLLPNAVIVESGSNANGIYVRYGDGTQICTLRIDTTDQAITDAYGSLYIGSRIWTFPKPFINASAIVSAPLFKYGTSASWGACMTAGRANATMRIYDNVSRSAGIMTYIGFMAIGRWK